MRLVLVGPTLEDNLATGYLAAALRAAGHQAVLVSFSADDEREAALREVRAAAPDVVGLSMTFQRRARAFLRLAADLRAGGFGGHIVAGGGYASLAADDLLAFGVLDSILVGEAEDSLVALAAALGSGGALASVPGIVLPDGRRGPRARRRADLDTLPFPVREGPPARLAGLPVAPLLASRGCHGRCAYCSIAAFAAVADGPARRERAPEEIAREMAGLARRRGARVFLFHDDDFLSGRAAHDLDRARRLARALAAAGLPRVGLAIKARPDRVDEEVLRALRRAGLVRVFLGIENAAPAALAALGRRHATPDAARRALALLGRLGVAVNTNLLLWEPGTTLVDLTANLELMEAFPGQVFHLARTELYQGAPLTERVAREGRLLGDALDADYRVADPAAELAWRLFRVVLGERFYAADGTAPTASALDHAARLVAHVFPATAADPLVAHRVPELVARAAASTRRWLRLVIDEAASWRAAGAGAGRTLRAAHALARAAREEDAVLARDLERAHRDLTRLASAAAALEAAPRRRARARTAVPMALAAAGAIACSPTNPAPRRPAEAGVAAPATPDAGAAGPGAAGPGAAADASIVRAPAPPTHVTIGLAADTARWEICDGPKPARRLRVTAALVPDAAHRIERLAASDGALRDLQVAPDGRRAIAWLEPGAARGVQHVTVTLRGDADVALEEGVAYFQYGDRTATVGAEAVAAPRCDFIHEDAPPPPPDQLLAADGPVIFVIGSDARRSGWGERFLFSVGLRAGVPGELAGPPEATCTTGRIVPRGPASRRLAPELRLRDVHYFAFDPAPADGTARLHAGEHACTVRFRVRAGARPKDVEGRLPVLVRPDGTVVLSPAAARGRTGALPLPLRYALRLRLVADEGDALVLAAEGPPDLPLRLAWRASAGTIAPLPGGAARWRPPAAGSPTGGPSVGVVTCASCAGPLDLQVASWRRRG